MARRLPALLSAALVSITLTGCDIDPCDFIPELCGPLPASPMERLLLPDADDDGLTDADETARGLNGSDGDSDDDGLGDAAEVRSGTDPLDADSDDDGLLDGAETNSDPRLKDSDGDGFGDKAERDGRSNAFDPSSVPGGTPPAPPATPVVHVPIPFEDTGDDYWDDDDYYEDDDYYDRLAVAGAAPRDVTPRAPRPVVAAPAVTAVTPVGTPGLVLQGAAPRDVTPVEAVGPVAELVTAEGTELVLAGPVQDVTPR